MAKINPFYTKLKREYIFPIIEKKLEELKQAHPESSIVNLGIGDIALPLVPSVVTAVCKATSEEMGKKETMKGYGPSEGYLFLREAIVQNEYKNLSISPDEVFVSDGANTDTSAIQEIFAIDSTVGITDPTYPVYFDSNVLAGRLETLRFLPCIEENGFAPLPPKERCDLIYLCTPNNPTGIALTKKELGAWVEYAKKEKAILLVDNAYAAFITSPDVPKTIYEIPGAHEVAIEFKSFSKSAGFTGLRCAYTIVPKTVLGYLEEQPISLHTLWKRRNSIKSNGVSYPIQKGALAVYSEVGKKETAMQVHSYLKQASYLLENLKKLGYTCYGGVDSPYIWWKVPTGFTSWSFFDLLLTKCHIISVPGLGFGKAGEGYVRLSSFTTEDKAKEAIQRITHLFT